MAEKTHLWGPRERSIREEIDNLRSIEPGNGVLYVQAEEIVFLLNVIDSERERYDMLLGHLTDVEDDLRFAQREVTRFQQAWLDNRRPLTDVRDAPYGMESGNRDDS